MKLFKPILPLMLVVLTLSACRDAGGSGDNRAATLRSADAPVDNALLAVRLPDTLDNVVVRYHAMRVDFNPRLHIPNCVTYELTNTMVAMADAPDAEKRSNYKFNRDTAVKGCPDWWEYKDMPYDRGHMAPAMDMRWNARAMSDCFLMTNICPQDHQLNNGQWRKMEEAIHSRWAGKYGRLVIATGPVLSDGWRLTGKKGGIAVPARFFKVVIAPDRGYGIAFVFDNAPTTHSWRDHAVSIDEVERITGYDFFAALDNSRESHIEAQNSVDKWPDYNRNNNRRNTRGNR